MVGSRVVLRRRKEIQETAGNLIRVSPQNRVVGVRVVRLVDVDDVKIILSSKHLHHVPEFVPGFDIQLRIDENEPAASDRLLVEQVFPESGLSDAGLPHNRRVPHHELVGDINGQILILGVTDA